MPGGVQTEWRSNRCEIGQFHIVFRRSVYFSTELLLALNREIKLLLFHLFNDVVSTAVCARLLRKRAS